MDFPRLFVCTFTANSWSALVNYGPNDLARDYSNVVWRSLKDANLNHPLSEGQWWTVDDKNINKDWFTPVKGWEEMFYTSGASITAVAYWNSPTSPDHWAEEETDAQGLGPAVRMSTNADTMYKTQVGCKGNPGEMICYISLFRRVDGSDTLLKSWLAGQEPVALPQATKLAVRGNPPVLSVAVRKGRSGEGAGYDPFERQLDAFPWIELGSYTDNSPNALLTGRPGLWNPISPLADGTSHWSYSDFGREKIGLEERPSPDREGSVNILKAE